MDKTINQRTNFQWHKSEIQWLKFAYRWSLEMVYKVYDCVCLYLWWGFWYSNISHFVSLDENKIKILLEQSTIVLYRQNNWFTTYEWDSSLISFNLLCGFKVLKFVFAVWFYIQKYMLNCFGSFKLFVVKVLIDLIVGNSISTLARWKYYGFF